MKADYRGERREYVEGTLSRDDLEHDPLVQFLDWMEDARQAGIPDATAMSLATADAQGFPAVRIVLLKEATDDGFSWFTYKRISKGSQLAENNRAELLFYWRELSRQIRIAGRVEELPDEDADEYFSLRPEGSRFSAASSVQGSVVESRELLEERVARLRAEYPEGDVPRPEGWGGYRLIPEVFEFWQGRESRLHDRFRYMKGAEGWDIRRLSP